MRERLLIGCATMALAILASSTSSVTACPWNGCGTDAHNSYVVSIYDNYYYAAPVNAPQVYGYAAPVYGYAAPVYGYAAPAYGYVSPRYYGPRRSYAGAVYYRARVARVGWRRW